MLRALVGRHPLAGLPLRRGIADKGRLGFALALRGF
jgi:hypothetical protein